MSNSPFGQVFKKRGGNNGNTGDSTFEPSEEKTEIPEIDGAVNQIDRRLNNSRDIVVQDEETMSRGCGC